MVAELARRHSSTLLTDAQKVALDFTDALIGSPYDIADELRARLHDHFEPDQIVEIALDVMKWSYQKVAVALGTDAEIRAGELTDLVFDDDGNWVRPT